MLYLTVSPGMPEYLLCLQGMPRVLHSASSQKSNSPGEGGQLGQVATNLRTPPALETLPGALYTFPLWRPVGGAAEVPEHPLGAHEVGTWPSGSDG